MHFCLKKNVTVNQMIMIYKFFHRRYWQNHMKQRIFTDFLPLYDFSGIQQDHTRDLLYNFPSCLMWNWSGSVQFSSVAQSWTHDLQRDRLPCPSPSLGACSNSCPSSWWCHPAISSFHPLSSPSPPAFSLSQHQGLFQWVSSLNQVAKILEFQLQHPSFQWIFRTDLL